MKGMGFSWLENVPWLPFAPKKFRISGILLSKSQPLKRLLFEAQLLILRTTIVPQEVVGDVENKEEVDAVDWNALELLGLVGDTKRGKCPSGVGICRGLVYLHTGLQLRRQNIHGLIAKQLLCDDIDYSRGDIHYTSTWQDGVIFLPWHTYRSRRGRAVR